jgi:lysophospholipase L1-like esterase
MRGRFPVVLTLALAPLLASPAIAEHPAECQPVEYQATLEFPLPQVARALKAKRLAILVMGAGSSTLPGASGAANAYPARLQRALSQTLPGVAVTVITDVKSRRTAADMAAVLPAALKSAKPALVVWQTGTVDAMQSVDPDQFSAALEKGVKFVHAAAADVILVNSQYSPRTESMIALGTYAEDMRWVAVQQQVPVFDRFTIMKIWSDAGTFDFYSATKKLDIAQQVHDCIGRLLAELIIEAAKQTESPPK